MSLTPSESALVRGSIPILKEHGETITSLFYASLLQAHPSLHNLFNSANQATGRQPRALLSVMLAFAAAPGHISELAPRLERVCNKHCSLGVEPAQYDVVGEYLLLAFGEVLGPERWTPDLCRAWGKAYCLLARMLSGREAQLYREFGEWKGWEFLTIDQKVAEADDVVSFHLVCPAGRRLPPFVPGQYVSVQVDVPSIRYLQSRQYSLSDCPSRGYYRITVRRSPGAVEGKGTEVARTGPGLVSNILIDMYQVGDRVAVSHPSGGFGFEAAGTSPLVLVSAGSGATPLMSMFNSVMGGPDADFRPVSWVHCTTLRVAPFEDHVRRIAAERKGDNVAARFLRGQFADEDDHRESPARGESLRVGLKGLGRDVLHLDHGAAGYFLCGPKTFTQDVARFLCDAGVDSRRIHSEWFATGDLELT